MSRKQKLVERLLKIPPPRDFTWDEATTLMNACGYELLNARGGGSGRMFVNRSTKSKIRLHEPHPQNTLLPYMVRELIEGLRSTGAI